MKEMKEMKIPRIIPVGEFKIAYPNHQFQMAVKMIGKFLAVHEIKHESIQIEKFEPTLSPVVELSPSVDEPGVRLLLKASINLGSRNTEVFVVYKHALLDTNEWCLHYLVGHQATLHDFSKDSSSYFEESKSKAVEDNFLKIRKFKYPFRFISEKITLLSDAEKYIRADVERQLLNDDLSQANFKEKYQGLIWINREISRNLLENKGSIKNRKACLKNFGNFYFYLEKWQESLDSYKQLMEAKENLQLTEAEQKKINKNIMLCKTKIEEEAKQPRKPDVAALMGRNFMENIQRQRRGEPPLTTLINDQISVTVGIGPSPIISDLSFTSTSMVSEGASSSSGTTSTSTTESQVSNPFRFLNSSSGSTSSSSVASSSASNSESFSTSEITSTESQVLNSFHLLNLNSGSASSSSSSSSDSSSSFSSGSSPSK